MKLTPQRRAVVLGMAALERESRRDHGWDLASVLVAAGRLYVGGGVAPDEADVRGLCHTNPAYVYRRPLDGRYELTEPARTWARTGA